MNQRELIYSGSVKDIYQDNNTHNLFFHFSDRYSIFDWGEMPDKIESKGKALSVMGAFFFKYFSEPNNWMNIEASENKKSLKILSHLKEKGLNSHFIKLNSDFELEVKKVDVIRPSALVIGNKKTWKYNYNQSSKNCLIPLEVIFRFGMPKGSSLSKRLMNNLYIKEIGLEETPKEGELFKEVIVEFSTKLEPEDRYINYQEAQQISGMTDDEFKNLCEMTKLIAKQVSMIFKKLEIEVWDGKFEFAFDEKRELILVDSIGLDELRLQYKDKILSKEFLRQYYRQSTWYQALEKSKEYAKSHPLKNWKEYCLKELNSAPTPLPSELKLKAQNLYTYIANELNYLIDKSKPFSQEKSLMQFMQEF